MTLVKGAQAGTPLVLPAPHTHSERCSQPGLTNPPLATASTPPSLSQQEHKGRRGLLIPSCSASPAVCASLGIRNNLPFATSQLAAGKQPMHPDLWGKGVHAEPPRKRLHPQHPPDKTICRWPLSHTPRSRPAGTAAGMGTQRTLQLPFPLPLPHLSSPPRRALAGVSCPPSSASPHPPLPARAGARGMPGGGAQGVPGGAGRLGPGLCCSPPARLRCSIPLGTSRGGCINTLSPKSIISGLLLSCGAGGSLWKRHLRFSAQKY